MWVSHLIVEIQNCLPGMLNQGHYTLCILHTSTPVVMSVSQTGTASVTPHLKHYQPRPIHFMDNTKLITGEGHLEVVSHVTVTRHTGHCDLSVIQPQPNLSSSLKPWQNPCGWQTKFSTHWVLHSDDHPTHILHLTPGHASALLHQEGQVPFSISWSIKLFICTCPSNSISSIILPASEPYIKQTSSYPEVSVLGCWASACHEYAQPLQQWYQLGNKTRHENGLLCTVKNEDEIWHHF